jgi:TolA-binding protein
MRAVPRRRAADFVVRPSLSEARLSRMWSALADAERIAAARRKRRRRIFPVLLATALAAMVMLGARFWPSPAPVTDGLAIDTGSADQEVTLPEGSHLHLAAATRLRVISSAAGEIRLRLERGSVGCDVVHREGRRFIVEAGGVEISDVGTRFSVGVHPDEDGGRDAVVVRVERGSVEVRDAARAVVATLGAGQAWESAAPPVPVATSTAEREAPVGSGEPPKPPAPPDPPVSAALPEPAPTATGAAQRPVLTAQVLYKRADAARLAGRQAEAAADFERLLRRFPADPRAGLAAYELGRIRLGSLHDPRGAADAFGAVVARGEGPFREDAEASRVEALAELGDDPACRRARDAFRARYPTSPRAARVARLCGRP